VTKNLVGWGSFSSRNCKKYAVCLKEEQETPNLIKAMPEKKKVPERRSSLCPFEKEHPERHPAHYVTKIPLPVTYLHGIHF
jgi:hypothetical protein